MRIYLAPMEGVVDAPMRAIQARIGGPDQMVTEFIRVSDRILPNRVFLRTVPELNTGCLVEQRIPLTLQLLGSNPRALAQNAVRALKLGAPGIDLNFGCPAKTVNKSRGGAIMLEEPQSVFDAVRAVREAVPTEIPVSAKMRLGYRDKSKAFENAQAIQDAGASYLCIHARTKVEGYKPPAHWEWIARIRETLQIPLIANGEVWTVDDYWRCRSITGCEQVMIGRGLIANPFLVEQIRNGIDDVDRAADWIRLQPYLSEFVQRVRAIMDDQYVPGRIKQWLSMLAWHFPQAKVLFEDIRRLRELEPLLTRLAAEPGHPKAVETAPEEEVTGSQCDVVSSLQESRASGQRARVHSP